MDGAFADIKTVTSSEDKDKHLSSLMTGLLKEKSEVAETALQRFNDWDANRDGALGLGELTDVWSSESATLSDRATAGVLAQNFNPAGNLSERNLEVETNSLFDGNIQQFNSVFANDFSRTGISRKDLNALSMLSSPDAASKFIDDAQLREKNEIAEASGWTWLMSGGALLMLGKLMLGKGSFLTGVAGFICGTQAIVNANYANNVIHNSDIPDLEAQIKGRKAMLESWEMPKL